MSFLALIFLLMGFLLLALGGGCLLVTLLAFFEDAWSGGFYLLVSLALVLAGVFLVRIGVDSGAGGGGGDFKRNPFLEPDPPEDGSGEDER